ncbi:MAG: glycosyltransferase family 2 protein [Bacteroidales bacterium]|nr:glycosyltransferase family 2 protein [Bacteroidales bacterium]
MNNSLISVVIPVYNYPEAFRKTLESVANQTYRDFEVHVVDDGSEEDIESVVKEISDERIRYHKLAHKNANVARNYGVVQSKGEYIAMLDSDDIWLEDHLEKCLELLKEKNADGLYGSLIINNVITNRKSITYVCEPDKDEVMINYLLLRGYGAQSSTLFMSAESAKKVIWDPGLNRHQDYDFVVRYCKEYKMAAKETPTVIYNLRPKSHCDFESCIRFIKRVESEINPEVYHYYHKNMLELAKRINAAPEIIKHYRNELTYHRELMSFKDFIQIKRPSSKLQFLKLKMQYIWHILRVRAAY